MPTIKLIVTGSLEELVLHESLRQIFPDTRRGDAVVWEQPRKLLSATSGRLPATGTPSKPMRDLANAMLTEVWFGKTGTPADLVIVVDDVELGNLNQEDVIAQQFRDAVTQQLEIKLSKDTHSLKKAEQYRTFVRERCSFHLLRPMVESYFFGDGDALRAIGVQDTPILLDTNVEQFEVTDPTWLPICLFENQRRASVAPWWRHERHPKHYLESLMQRNKVFYEETNHGVTALQNLAWSQVPKSATECAIVRSLFEDLSDWFEIPNPMGPGDKQPYLYPRGPADRSKLLIRNL